MVVLQDVEAGFFLAVTAGLGRQRTGLVRYEYREEGGGMIRFQRLPCIVHAMPNNVLAVFVSMHHSVLDTGFLKS